MDCEKTVCERCGERPATLHWTEAFGEGEAGAVTVIERHLCQECRVEDPPGEMPDLHRLRFQCRCGELLTWRFPHGGCGHPAEAYEHLPKGKRRETEIAACACGARYFTVGMRWRCRDCGAESILEPRPTGLRGYLLDHVHGVRTGAAIKIRVVIP